MCNCNFLPHYFYLEQLCVEDTAGVLNGNCIITKSSGVMNSCIGRLVS